jgi:hypothetical protein
MRTLTVLLLVTPALSALDLTGAKVVAPPSLTSREKKAVTMLVEEVEKRSQIRWPVVTTPDAGPSIHISKGSGPAEGYTIEASGPAIRVTGNDERGVLFGIGHLLRTLRYARGRIQSPDSLRVTTAPKIALRGHQLGYRPKTNSYDGTL